MQIHSLYFSFNIVRSLHQRQSPQTLLTLCNLFGCLSNRYTVNSDIIGYHKGITEKELFQEQT